MPIRFFCPFGHLLVVPDHRAGKKGRCPTCDQKVSVPAPTPVPLGGGGKPLLSGPDGPVRRDPAPPTMNLGFEPDDHFERWFGPLPGAASSDPAVPPPQPVESSRLPALDLFSAAPPSAGLASAAPSGVGGAAAPSPGSFSGPSVPAPGSKSERAFPSSPGSAVPRKAPATEAAPSPAAEKGKGKEKPYRGVDIDDLLADIPDEPRG